MSALTEETSLVVSGVNVAELTDEELYAKLKAFGIDVGPIVGKLVNRILRTQCPFFLYFHQL